jgi:mediator of RNA polymerase II transcription subunit 14
MSNGITLDAASSLMPHANWTHVNGIREPTREELERELPVVYDGQISLGDLLSRVVQAIYAELSELAET